MESLTGYQHPGYPHSFSEFGTPRFLAESGGWILERPIPGTMAKDAMGCYPLFTCRDWSALPADLEELGPDLVSLALVTDPFGDYREEQLRQWFRDRVRLFKEHYVLDLKCPIEEVTRSRAQRYARAALREMEVEVCPRPADLLEDWLRLYGHLVERHHLAGIHSFSRESFAAQMQVPGFVLFRAVRQGETIGMLSWYVQGPVAYAHLIAVNLTGYELRASYALYWASIQHFRGGLEWLDLGGVPGVDDDSDGGLAKFKRGWSSGTRPTYFCGRILNPEAYAALMQSAGGSDSEYFPAYRAGEFQ